MYNTQYDYLTKTLYLYICKIKKNRSLFFDKKNSLVALEFLDIIKTVNIYD